MALSWLRSEILVARRREPVTDCRRASPNKAWPQSPRFARDSRGRVALRAPGCAPSRGRATMSVNGAAVGHAQRWLAEQIRSA